MLIIEILKDKSAKWDRHQPAPESAIQSPIEQSNLDLPDDYISFSGIVTALKGNLVLSQVGSGYGQPKK